MSNGILINPAELADLTKTVPCVIIDTRTSEAYGESHIPGAVNLHDIFTYLATSTLEGIAELKDKFETEFGAAGLSGKETAIIYEAIHEHRFRPVLPWLFSAAISRLSANQGATRRL